MKGSKREVSCLRDPQCRFNGFQVSHLSDKNHVWILSQNVSQGGIEGCGISRNLPLVHKALLVGVEVFYGIFNRDYMFVSLGIYPVDHGGKGSGLTRSRWSCY
jgi:hypothetical protein